MEHDMQKGGAERELDAIHAGGSHLLAVIRQQIAKALDRLDEGDFSDCQDSLQAAGGMVGSLAYAKRFIAVADGSRLIPARDLMEGQELTGMGAISSVKVEECPTCKHHISVKIGEHELQFRGEQEVYVVNDHAA